MHKKSSTQGRSKSYPRLMNLAFHLPSCWSIQKQPSYILTDQKVLCFPPIRKENRNKKPTWKESYSVHFLLKGTLWALLRIQQNRKHIEKSTVSWLNILGEASRTSQLLPGSLAYRQGTTHQNSSFSCRLRQDCHSVSLLCSLGRNH